MGSREEIEIVLGGIHVFMMVRIFSSKWPDFFPNQRIKGLREKVNETQVSKTVRPA